MDSENQTGIEMSREEVLRVIQVIASTGKFWHDWDKLKDMLSFQLKQVLSGYAEANMTDEQQNACLGETYAELVERLDAALHNFDEGPPFTLQRLCEILLDARGIYPNLSKLALALEKNLLVTSTLSVSTDPYPEPTVHRPDEESKGNKTPELPRDPAENGLESGVGVRDEKMTEVDEADGINDMAVDMEALEEIAGSSDTSSKLSTDS